jgi:hypothetical protein
MEDKMTGWRLACGSLCLLLTAEAAGAKLNVGFQPPKQPDGYYIISEAAVRNITDRARLREKVEASAYRFAWSEPANPPSGRFYVFPQCNGRAWPEGKLIFGGQREVVIRCP